MTGKLRDLSFNSDRTQNITFTVGTDFRADFDRLKGQRLDITIKPHKEKRSLSANAFAWVIIDKIAACLHEDKVTIYREAIRNIGGVSEPVCVRDKAVDILRKSWEQRGLGWITDTMESSIKGCTVVILYYGSSSYDKAQMSALIDHLLQDAQALGLTIDRPEVLDYEPKHNAS